MIKTPAILIRNESYLLTVLICIANPFIHFLLVKYFGLEPVSLKHSIFEDPTLINYSTAMMFEYLSIYLVKKVRIPIVTDWLICIFSVLVACHAFAFVITCVINLSNDQFLIATLEELVTGSYHAIINLLFYCQIFCLIVGGVIRGRDDS